MGPWQRCGVRPASQPRMLLLPALPPAHSHNAHTTCARWHTLQLMAATLPLKPLPCATSLPPCSPMWWPLGLQGCAPPPPAGWEQRAAMPHTPAGPPRAPSMIRAQAALMGACGSLQRRTLLCRMGTIVRSLSTPAGFLPPSPSPCLLVRISPLTPFPPYLPLPLSPSLPRRVLQWRRGRAHPGEPQEHV